MTSVAMSQRTGPVSPRRPVTGVRLSVCGRAAVKEAVCPTMTSAPHGQDDLCTPLPRGPGGQRRGRCLVTGQVSDQRQDRGHPRHCSSTVTSDSRLAGGPGAPLTDPYLGWAMGPYWAVGNRWHPCTQQIRPGI